MTWPAAILWALFFWGAMSRGPALLYLFMVAGAFGTLQMLPGEVVGGANVLPQPVCAVFLIGKVMLKRGNLQRALAAAIDVRHLGLLTGFAVYSIPAAFLLPRFFAGRVEVFSVSDQITSTSLLQPTFAIVTQCGYMALSIGTALAMAVIGSRPDVRRHMLGAVLTGGLAAIASGFVDLAAYTAGLSAQLAPFRTATYSLLTDVEALGSKRVVGFMPEASSYGLLCVTGIAALIFLRPCFDARLRRIAVPATIGGLFVMAAISTSSSAYVGLAVLAPLFGLNWLVRLGSRTALARDGLQAEFVVVLLAGFALFCTIVLVPHVLDPVYDMIDALVLKKSASASYVERSSWTEAGWQAFWTTGGLGVGLGSVRVSNWFVSILSSTGVFGSLLMFGFIVKCFATQPASRSPLDREWSRGLRCSLLPQLVMAGLSATMPDIGVAMGAFLGLLVAVGERGRESLGSSPAPVRGPLVVARQPVVGAASR